jgi:hypothetical protein
VVVLPACSTTSTTDRTCVPAPVGRMPVRRCPCPCGSVTKPFQEREDNARHLQTASVSRSTIDQGSESSSRIPARALSGYSTSSAHVPGTRTRRIDPCGGCRRSRSALESHHFCVATPGHGLAPGRGGQSRAARPGRAGARSGRLLRACGTAARRGALRDVDLRPAARVPGRHRGRLPRNRGGQRSRVPGAQHPPAGVASSTPLPRRDPV